MGFYQSDRLVFPIGFPLHGFELIGGSFAQIDFPGASQTTLAGINDAGDIVGSGGLLSAGSITPVNFPGSAFTKPEGINNAGGIVGGWTDGAGNAHGFVLNKGVFTPLDFLRATATTAFGINDAGDIVGSYTDTNGQGHGFITNPISLVDPVPDLLNGSTVAIPTTQGGAQLLATKGTTVQGVAADGVAEVVIRIMASNVGDQFILTLVNDQNTQIIPDEDGALGSPGDTSFSQGQITVTAVDTGSGPNGPNPPFAFAIYRAPIDFARQVSPGLYKSGSCAGVTGSDDQLGCRSVSLKMQDSSGTATTVPITILRPPVILIHGMWADRTSWNNFAPFNVPISTDGRFSSGAVGYDAPVAIASSNPDIDSMLLPTVLGNSMGFQYNAPDVASQIDALLQNFKNGQNPQGIAVADVQGDIVAHSMGGDITRFLASQADFLSPQNFAQGDVHKLITIDTPHLGTPLATDLLSGQNDCTAAQFATFGKFNLISVVLKNGFTRAGATADLQGDGNGGGMSPNLAVLNDPLFAQHPLPTALAAATDDSNLSGITDSVAANLLRNICLSYGDPVVVNLTSSAWPNVFSGQVNDAIVPLNSELNRINGSLSTIVSPNSLFTSPGNIHSGVLSIFGFRGPTVLDAGPVPAQVIKLLNTPVTDPVFNQLNP